MPLLIGHRGTRIHAPENTLAAFRWAVAAGADGVELDVRLCGSGELVVVHDPDLKRVADLPWEVVDTPYSELSKADLGAGQRISLLADVLDEMLARGVLVHVEVKANRQDIERLSAAVSTELVARGPRALQQICVSSFSVRVLGAVAANAPRITLAALAERHEQMPCADALGTPAEIRSHTPGLHPSHTLVREPALAGLREQGRFVNVWTVNDVALARRLSAAGVDGIITDDVQKIRRGL